MINPLSDNTVYLNCTGDTFINQGNQHWNFGTDSQLLVRDDINQSEYPPFFPTDDSFVSFDEPGVPFGDWLILKVKSGGETTLPYYETLINFNLNAFLRNL